VLSLISRLCFLNVQMHYVQNFALSKSTFIVVTRYDKVKVVQVFLLNLHAHIPSLLSDVRPPQLMSPCHGKSTCQAIKHQYAVTFTKPHTTKSSKYVSIA
jgi:hypothetical protein